MTAPSRTIRVPEPVADLLRASVVDGNALRLPQGQLDRKLYEAVNKAIVAIGGKWNRGQKAHIFASSEDLEQRLVDLLGGTVSDAKAAGFWPTPAALVARLVSLAEVDGSHSCLEPSAGHGAIADGLSRLVAAPLLSLVELLPENCRVLRDKGYDVFEADFLTVPLPATFDRVVMNPPFERKQDIAHVTRAFSLLRPGGRLVSVMSAGVAFRQDKTTVAFRELIEAHGHFERNPDGSFAEQGTGVATLNVVLAA